jgi:hypothetical protein
VWVHGDPSASSDQATSRNPSDVPASNADAPGGGPAVILGQGIAPAGPSDQVSALVGGPNPGGVLASAPNRGSTQVGSRNRDGAPLTRQCNGGQGENTGRVRVAGVALRASDLDHHRNLGTSSPQGVEGVLAQSLPIDLTALDRAIDQCLGQIDAMGDSLAELLTSDGAWPWLAGAVVASAAGAMAHWWGRRSRYRPLTLVDGEGMLSSWFLDSISRG